MERFIARLSKVLCFSLLAFAGFAGVLPAAHATDAAVVGDASVNSAYPTTNFGALSNLYVGNGNTTLIQFDLSSLPPGSTASQIARATLRLYVNRVNTAGPVNVQPVTSAWQERAVTYTTLPSIGTASTSFTAGTAQQFVVVDVTALVQSWVTTPSSNFGLALSSSSANVLFDSKENDETSHVSHLDITLVSQGPAGAQGPAGPTGATGATGSTGPAGPTGATGAAGPTGSAGATGATGTFSYASDYAAATTYTAGQVVFCSTACSVDGSSYISLGDANQGSDPPTSPAKWALIAQAGATGAQGPIGATGPQGPAGANGATGPAGATGATGATGAAGPQGSIGATGPQGPAGATGAAGPAGPAGTTGPQGSTGATGAQGPTGATGAAGTFSFASNYSVAATYAQGQVVFCSTACSTNGSSYISLENGNQGFDPPTNTAAWALVAQAGATGATGSAGPAGAQGATGAAGAQGPAGATGAQGATGATGVQGPAGAQGATGTTGAQGPTGATGAQGATGATGAQGPTGATGPAGESSHIFLANVVLGASNTATEFFALTSSGEPSISGLATGYNTFATIFPIACTFDSLYLATGLSSGNFTSQITITLYQNGVATTLTDSIQPPATNTLVTAQLTGQSISVAAGDTLALEASSSSFSTNGGTGPYAIVSVTLHCE